MPGWVYTLLAPSMIIGWFLMLALVSYAGGWSALARTRSLRTASYNP